MPWWLKCFGKSYEPPEVMELDFRHSNLTEVPPDVFTYERTLEKLSLGSNQITTLPPSLFHCYELRELELYDNELQSIPAAIGSLTRLTRLNASRNGITEVADTIKNCKSLSHLDLSLNHLVKLPEGISQLIGLEELNLSDTYLEYLNANFGRLTKLRVLELRENMLQSLPKSMTRFTHLHRLDLGQNDFHEIPEVVGTMTSLAELFLDNNSIRAIPPLIGQLTKLNSLDCSNNDIYEVADEICKCSQLEDLSLNMNSIGGLPDAFGKLESLTVLRLDNNQIQYLPENFGHLKNLQEFSVVRNLLKALPPSIGLLRKLHTLLLDENLLTELPKEIGSCVQLSVLHAAKNRLSTIPSEIGHLSNLKVLSLSKNSIIHLPVSILNIDKLGAIWLSESQTKPLLPFNKEIDSYTGQHVLTCFLLPQLPAVEDVNLNESPKGDNEYGELLQRSRQSTIKFADIVEEPTKGAGDAQANTSQRPIGLFRAPTPYPKELRAMAKHASQVYSRHPKDQNGDVPNNEGVAYENDFKVEVTSSGDHSTTTCMERPTSSEQMVKNPDICAVDRYLSNKMENHVDFRSVHYDSIRRMRLGGQAVANTDHNLLASEPRTEPKQTSSFPTHGTVTDTSKTPPPYDLAARRAAFFRRSSSTSSTSIPHEGTSNSTVTPNSGLVSQPSLQSPELVANITHKEIHQPGPRQRPQDDLLNVTYTKEERPKQNAHNATFTMEDHSSVVDNSLVHNSTFSVISSAREELPNGNTTCKMEENGDKSKVLEEKRIIESIIRDSSALGKSPVVVQYLEDDVDGGLEPSDGPPIIPMKPISGNYSQFRSSVSSGHSSTPYFSRNVSLNESFSKIPVFNSKTSDFAAKSISTPKNSLIAGFSRQSSISNSPSNDHDSTDSNLSPNAISNSKIPVFLAPGQALTFSKVTPADCGGSPESIPYNHREIPRVNNKSNVQISSVKSKNSLSPNNESGSFDKPKEIEGSGTVAKFNKISNSESTTNNPNSSNLVRRSSSGSKIPRITSHSPSVSGSGPENSQLVRDTSSPESSNSISGSKIPSFGRKPWIFGSHRNTRVVPLEYKKVNQLGFTVCNSPFSGASPDSGVYIDSVDLPDSAVKLGDKLLQVDGIDIANMNLEIVRKILSNCQENINLLVSRDS